MPSSGSTTSRSASSTSATFAGVWVVSVMSSALLCDGFGKHDVDASADQCVGEGGPAQQGALDASGVPGDPGKGHTVADHRLVTRVLALGGQHRAHGVVCLERLAHGVSGYLLG